VADLGNYGSTNRVAHPLFLAIVAAVAAVILGGGSSLLVYSTMRGQFNDAVDDQVKRLDDKFNERTDSLVQQLTVSAAAESKRSDALSVRINGLEDVIRDNQASFARTDQRLAGIETALTSGTQRRDRQAEEFNKQLDNVRGEITKGQVGMARTETLLEQLIELMHGGDVTNLSPKELNRRRPD